MTNDDHTLADLLLAIEAELRALGLWEATPPPAEAMQSLVPFCHDTLSFPQWLQWVFLPRMKRVLESGEGMPASSDIQPLAEYALQDHPADVQALLSAIARFDAFIQRR